jgi:hypothetical protein
MDVHKPKGAHSWREFAIEIGTIVVGVLIALAAEQTAELIHWTHKVAEAEDAMRLELRDDDLPQAYARIAIYHCLAASLDRIETAVDDGRDRAAITEAAKAFDPPGRTWDLEAWRAAVASDSASHMSAARMTMWSGPYRILPEFIPATAAELDAQITLRVGRHLTGPLSQSERDAKLAAVEKARANGAVMAISAYALLRAAANAGVELTPKAGQEILTELRGKYGACVTVPAPLSMVDLKGQAN